MKKLLLYSALFFTAACSSKKDDPAVVTPTVSPVVYTDASGTKTNLTAFSAYSVTATPTSSGSARRAIVMRTTLPNGSTLDLTHVYVNTHFPGATGPVTLDEGVTVDNYGGPLTAATRTQYKAPLAAGTLSVDSLTPQIVSSTYTGPLVSGGSNVTVVFTKLTI